MMAEQPEHETQDNPVAAAAAEDGLRAAGRWWTSTTFAAGLTAVCTALVALASFLSGQAASDSADLYAQSALDLPDANFFLEQGVDSLLEDFPDELTRFCILGLLTDSAEERCTDGELSVLAEFAAEDTILEIGSELDTSANAAFDDGLEESKRSVAYQAALVMFAVGLALSAWAALSETGRRTRVIFEVLAIVSVAVGLARLVTV